MVPPINKEPNSNATDLDSGSERRGIFSVARSNTSHNCCRKALKIAEIVDT